MPLLAQYSNLPYNVKLCDDSCCFISKVQEFLISRAFFLISVSLIAKFIFMIYSLLIIIILSVIMFSTIVIVTVFLCG